MINVKKTIAVTLAAFIAAAACSCGKNNENQNDNMEKLIEGKYKVTEKGEPLGYSSFTFDYLGGETVMPIGGYWGPYISELGSTVDGYKIPDLISDEIYSAIAEAGVNMIVRSQETASLTDSATVEKTLEIADKYGIGVFTPVAPVDALAGRGTTYKKGDEYPFSMTEYASLIRKLAAYDSFLGVSVTDEPLWSQMDGLEEAFRLFEKLGYGDKYASYTNVLPWTNSPNGFAGNKNKGVDEYFDTIYNEVKIPYLSSTGYYYTQKNTPDAQLANMFVALSNMRKCAIKYNVPLWRMLQAGGQWNDSMDEVDSVDPYPNEGEFLFDVNVALAYGCKAIQYFPLVQPYFFAFETGGKLDFKRNGLISAAGKKTEWWDYAKKANEQIKAIDHILMKSASVGLIAHGENAISLSRSYDESRTEFFKEEKFRQLTSVTGGDCYIGCFDYKGGTALYVVNYDRNGKTNVSLGFDDYYGYEITQRATTAEVMGKTVDLTLECGEGVLIVLK